LLRIADTVDYHSLHSPRLVLWVRVIAGHRLYRLHRLASIHKYHNSGVIYIHSAGRTDAVGPHNPIKMSFGLRNKNNAAISCLIATAYFLSFKISIVNIIFNFVGVEG
jgi:hypothetical protein